MSKDSDTLDLFVVIMNFSLEESMVSLFTHDISSRLSTEVASLSPSSSLELLVPSFKEKADVLLDTHSSHGIMSQRESVCCDPQEMEEKREKERKVKLSSLLLKGHQGVLLKLSYTFHSPQEE